MYGVRAWKVYADEHNFLGYEYAKDQEEVQTKAVKKFGAPEKWGITSYKIELIQWSGDP